MTAIILTLKLFVAKIGGFKVDTAAVIELFAQIAGPAFGVAFVFGMGAKIVHSFLSMGLDGKFKI